MIRATRLAFLALGISLVCPAFAQNSVPSDVIDKIKEEGTQRSQVMQTLSYLTDVIGPRLTGSPSLKRANEWTRDTMTKWGMQSAHLEAWGPFGRGWSLERFSAQVVAPQCIPLIAYPKAWSPSVHANGQVVIVDATDEAGLEKYKGKLKGAIVFNGKIRELKAWFDPQGRRYTDAELSKMATATGTEGRPRPVPSAGGYMDEHEDETQPPGRPNQSFTAKKAEFYQKEGVALLVDPSFAGDGGTLFVMSASVPQSGKPGSPRISAYDKNSPKITPQIVLANEDYNRLTRMIQQGETLTMNVEIKAKYHDKDLMAYNTVAEIPGSDKKDEVVMMGGHLDSWHGSTGATDNGAGVAVAMEAARILKALNLQPRRTIRVGLWTGEEQGLFGSRAYVAQHFAERPTSTNGGTTPQALVYKPEHEKFSVYYNLDNGTGKIRGIYTQRNEAVAILFGEWLTPFKDMGATTVTLSNTGGTDHQSFDGVGLPGFQFIQDPIEYGTRTHHSNQDNFDRIQGDDLKQAAVIMATFAYQSAMREEKIPRKPAPAPRPAPSVP